MATARLGAPLAAAGSQLRVLAEQAGSSVAPETSLRTRRIAQILESDDIVSHADAHPVGAELALVDVQALVSRLETSSAVDPLAARLLDRASASALELHSLVLMMEKRQGAGAHAPAGLLRLTEAYGGDAKRGQIYAAGATVFAVACSAMSVQVVRRAADNSEANQRLSVGPFLARSSAGLLLLLLAGLLLVIAARQSRTAREARRLQRQLAGLSAYLAPLPDAANHLMRITMIQRLFPRLLEDNDPLREQSLWPDAEAVLSTIRKEEG